MTHPTPLTLAELTERTGLDVLAHLERSLSIPVIDGIQAQGDLIVVPRSELPRVTRSPLAHWQDVGADGVELLRGANGGNPHTLVADRGTCAWTPYVRDAQGLTLCLVTNSAPAYLIHPEHGATGIAPGTWTIRRQRERGDPRTPGGARLVQD
ncbi:hypothetical protein [Streptomyces radicis]|nr:hypothetical protein [Streptomyces radicis]